MKKKRVKVTEKLKTKIECLYSQGISATQIGKMLGVDSKKVLTHLRNVGITVRWQPTVITEEMTSQFEKLYKDGLSTREIGKMFGIGHTNVFKHLVSIGVELRQQKTKLTNEMLEQMKELYQAGKSQREIGNLLGVSQTFVSDSLMRNGISRQNNRAKQIIEPKQIIEMYLAGQSQREIASIVGTSQGKISHLLKKNGVKTRQPQDYSEHLPQIKEMYLQGQSTYKIGETFGISRDAVTKLLKGADVEIRKREKITPELKEQMRKLFVEDKMTLRAIAELLGLNVTTIRKTLRAMGIESRQLSEEEKDEIRVLYLEKGLAVAEIAEKFDVSRQAIDFQLRAMGMMSDQTAKKIREEITRKKLLDKCLSQLNEISDGRSICLNPDEFVDRETPNMIFKHVDCNVPWTTSFTNILGGAIGCPICRNLWTEDFIRSEIERVHGKNISIDESLLPDKWNSACRLNLICNVCGHRWETEAKNVITLESGCRVCNTSTNSKGVQAVTKILDDSGIDYTREARFQSCRNKQALFFDYFVPELNLLIEVDGAQHYNPNSKWYTPDGVHRDKIKDTFCYLNGYNFLRFPQSEWDKIPAILPDILEMLKAQKEIVPTFEQEWDLLFEFHQRFREDKDLAPFDTEFQEDGVKVELIGGEVCVSGD